eukprot:5236660-Pyramimonas_sp.AAC.1
MSRPPSHSSPSGSRSPLPLPLRPLLLRWRLPDVPMPHELRGASRLSVERLTVCSREQPVPPGPGTLFGSTRASSGCRSCLCGRSWGGPLPQQSAPTVGSSISTRFE